MLFLAFYLNISTGDIMKNKVNLTSVEIYNKEFPTVAQGYDPDEVDRVLDAVIEDYQYFENLNSDAGKNQEKITELKLNNDELLEQNESLVRQVRKITDQKIAAENRVAEVLRQNEEALSSNADKLQAVTSENEALKDRISELEEKLSEQITPQSINQLEVLKRIARIEQKVFGKD